MKRKLFIFITILLLVGMVTLYQCGDDDSTTPTTNSGSATGSGTASGTGSGTSGGCTVFDAETLTISTQPINGTTGIVFLVGWATIASADSYTIDLWNVTGSSVAFSDLQSGSGTCSTLINSPGSYFFRIYAEKTGCTNKIKDSNSFTVTGNDLCASFAAETLTLTTQPTDGLAGSQYSVHWTDLVNADYYSVDLYNSTNILITAGVCGTVASGIQVCNYNMTTAGTFYFKVIAKKTGCPDNSINSSSFNVVKCGLVSTNVYEECEQLNQTINTSCGIGEMSNYTIPASGTLTIKGKIEQFSSGDEDYIGFNTGQNQALNIYITYGTSGTPGDVNFWLISTGCGFEGGNNFTETSWPANITIPEDGKNNIVSSNSTYYIGLRAYLSASGDWTDYSITIVGLIPPTCNMTNANTYNELEGTNTANVNGATSSAESTGFSLSTTGDSFLIKGNLQDGTVAGTSGNDYYSFTANGGTTSYLKCRLEYCIQNLSQWATIYIAHGNGVPIDSSYLVCGSGSFTFTIKNGIALNYFIVVNESATDYLTTQYQINLSVEELEVKTCEGFDGAIIFPTGWASYEIGPSTTVLWGTSSSYVYGGTKSAYHNYTNSSSNLDESYLVMPQITVPSSGTRLLKFWTYTSYLDTYGYHGLWLSTTSGVPTSTSSNPFIQLIETSNTLESTWEQITVDLTPYAGQTIYLAFRYYGAYADIWHLDNVCYTW